MKLRPSGPEKTAKPSAAPFGVNETTELVLDLLGSTDLIGQDALTLVRNRTVGGASVGLAGGLTGLAGRVEGVDGTFSVSSPAGGPTLVRAVLPVPAWRDAGAEVTTPGT